MQTGPAKICNSCDTLFYNSTIYSPENIVLMDLQTHNLNYLNFSVMYIQRSIFLNYNLTTEYFTHTHVVSNP